MRGSDTDDMFALNTSPIAQSPTTVMRPRGRVNPYQRRQSSAHIRNESSVNNGFPSSGDSEAEIIITINRQTSGTEFYGPSSNFVSLNELLAKARKCISRNNPAEISSTRGPEVFSENRLERVPSLPHGSSQSTAGDSPNTTFSPKDHSRTPLSVVDLLCDENATLPEPPPTAPVTVAGRAPKPPGMAQVTPTGIVSTSPVETNLPQQPEGHGKPVVSSGTQAPVANFSECFFGNPMLLEIEYVNFYFQNLHCISPFLSPDLFKARCESEIWSASALKRLRRNQMHFLALYNAVLAVGSLTAPIDALYRSRAELDTPWEEINRDGPRKAAPTSIRLSKLYFQRARKLLGDVFEICSLEGAQTLLLLV